jgi:hypothetical protein
MQEEVWNSRNPLAHTSKLDSEYVTDENLQDLILDLFPRIPETDMMNIIKHAFERVMTRVLITFELLTSV